MQSTDWNSPEFKAPDPHQLITGRGAVSKTVRLIAERVTNVQAPSVDDYLVPEDPMDALQCDSCQ